MKTFSYLLVLFLIPGLSLASTEGIAAVVNDEVISLSDLDTRIRMTLLTLKQANTAAARRKIQSRLLKTIIDERLKSQKMKALNLRVSSREVDRAVANLANINHIRVEQLLQILKQQNISVAILRAKLKAELGWSYVMQRTLRPKVTVGDNEIDEKLAALNANIGKPEYRIAEIFLEVPSFKEEQQTKKFAQRLIEQIKEGTNFKIAARQFSQNAGADSGGEMGWVLDGQLSDRLNVALKAMSVGDISPPIRMQDGYHILLLEDRRNVLTPRAEDMKLHLKQIVVPSEKMPKNTFYQAENIRASLAGCSSMDFEISRIRTPLSGDLGIVRLGDLPAVIADAVKTLPIGLPSRVLSTETGIVILMVCQREHAKVHLPTRNQIRKTITIERLDILQRRLLHSLRSSAFIDIR